MKSISIYSYKNKIFVIPEAFITNGPIILVDPIVNTDLSYVNLKAAILNSFNYCGFVDKPPLENTFKKLLIVSKAKSNKNLVTNGKLLGINQNENIYILKKMESNHKNKSFGGIGNLEYSLKDFDNMISEIIKYFTPAT